MSTVPEQNHEDDQDYLQSRLLGVDAYMVKPVDMNKFLEVVRKLRHRWLADVVLPTAIYLSENAAAPSSTELAMGG